MFSRPPAQVNWGLIELKNLIHSDPAVCVFTAALLEIPFLFPTETKRSLTKLIEIADEKIRGHAEWLLEFCSEGSQE